MKQSRRAQAELEQRAAASRADRMRTAHNYLQGDWLNLAGTRQTYDRLVRKGHRDKAEQLLHMADQPIAGGSGLESMSSAEAEARAEQLNDVGRVVFEAVIGINDIMPVNFLHTGSRVARSIGRVILFPNRAPNGSGFLVSPRLFLTNNHVLANPGAAMANLVQFNYFAGKDGGPISPAEFRFRPDEFFFTNPVEELDFTLVAVEPANAEGLALQQFGWNNLLGELGKAQQGERLNVIHHPQGRPQQVSIRENFLALILDRHLHYVTDTEPGSSGSPVFNDEWEVVALHHASRDITDPDEIALYLEILRGVEPPGLAGQERFSVTINEGIRVSRLVNKFNEMVMNLTTGQQTLLADVLRALPPPDNLGLAGPIALTTTRVENAPAIDPAGTVTWTIPLQVSINLGGQLPAIAPVLGRPVTPVRSTTMAASPLALELYQDEINSQKSVFRALAFLQESRERDYLPAEQVIAASKQEYYGAIIDDVQNNIAPDALYETLHAKLRETISIVGSFPQNLESLESLPGLGNLGLEAGQSAKAQREYAQARAHLYTWVDLYEDRMLHGVYTDTLIAPEQLMLKDLIVQLGQEELLPRRFGNDQFLNCEHIVPQSWFNYQDIGVSDLHHLITADGQANNFRRDCSYNVLNGAGEEGPDDRPVYIPAAGRRIFSERIFEPARNKPVVARATLYFIIAHKHFIDSSKYNAGQIEILKDWAKMAPPSRYELHRNEAIFEAQGNRNPLIDFPEWIDKIDFTRGLKPI